MLVFKIIFYLILFIYLLFYLSSSFSLQAMPNIIVFLARLFMFFSFSSSSSSSLVAGSSSSSSDFFLTELFANGSSLSVPNQLWGDSLNSYVYVGRWTLYISRIAVSSRAVTLYAGTGANADHIDGAAATSSPMAYCRGVCGDTAGSLYVTCLTYNRIVKIDIPTGERRDREREKKKRERIGMGNIYST
jgi:hypothetical protein